MWSLGADCLCSNADFASGLNKKKPVWSLQGRVRLTAVSSEYWPRQHWERPLAWVNKFFFLAWVILIDTNVHTSERYTSFNQPENHTDNKIKSSSTLKITHYLSFRGSIVQSQHFKYPHGRDQTPSLDTAHGKCSISASWISRQIISPKSQLSRWQLH